MPPIQHSFLAPLRRAIAATALAVAVATGTASLAAAQQGSWTGVGFDIRGSWSIVEEGGQQFVVFDEAFSTKSGPDLHVLLSPRPLSQLTDEDAAEGALVLGKLQSNSGAQRYQIPAGTDLSAYDSLVIHCVKFGHLWGGAGI